jgi:hypothetical protein
MGLFSSPKQKTRYAALIDIGSGSVLTAIIESNQKRSHPTILWSKREYSPLRKNGSANDSAKSVMTSLMNALMALDGEGRKALFEKTKQNKITDLQVTVAAPWSYTVTKTIAYQNDEEFTISEELIHELLRTAETKVLEEMHEQEKTNQLGLTVVSKNTVGIIANGYKINLNNSQKANNLKVMESSAVVQNYLVKAVTDAGDRMFPSITPSLHSFILPYYEVIAKTEPDLAEYCLVDITYEATEIGIVRDGLLTYCSHVPYGAYTLTRELASLLDVPLEEAYGYLSCEDLNCFVTKNPDIKKEQMDAILINYRTKLVELFSETGDTLAIPKKIFIHANFSTEEFFSQQISTAATLATKMHHSTHKVTSEMLEHYYKAEAKAELLKNGSDTALLISAQFFHTHSRE